MKHPKKEGFTLIELMITMIIIGVLASFAVAMLWRSKDRGYEASMQADLRNLTGLQESYFERNMEYAGDISALTDAVISPGVVIDITHASRTGWAGTSKHPSVESRICGLRVGDAPLSAATAAVAVGYVQCTTE